MAALVDLSWWRFPCVRSASGALLRSLVSIVKMRIRVETKPLGDFRTSQLRSGRRRDVRVRANHARLTFQRAHVSETSLPLIWCGACRIPVRSSKESVPVSATLIIAVGTYVHVVLVMRQASHTRIRVQQQLSSATLTPHHSTPRTRTVCPERQLSCSSRIGAHESSL